MSFGGRKHCRHPRPSAWGQMVEHFGCCLWRNNPLTRYYSSIPWMSELVVQISQVYSRQTGLAVGSCTWSTVFQAWLLAACQTSCFASVWCSLYFLACVSGCGSPQAVSQRLSLCVHLRWRPRSVPSRAANYRVWKWERHSVRSSLTALYIRGTSTAHAKVNIGCPV